MHSSGPRRRGLEVFSALSASLVFALVFSYPIVAKIAGLGLDHDWDKDMELHWVPYYSVVHFHQFPFWDPYKCGGLPLLGNPSSRILTPFFLLHLLFGPLVGIHLEMIVHLAIGFGGAYLLARLLDIGVLGAVACGCAFAGSSWYYLHLAVGHSTFMSLVYVPFVVALFWAGTRRRQLIFAVAIGLVAALIFFEGGFYQSSYLAVLLSVLAIVLSVQHGNVFPIGLLAVAGVFVLSFSAPKLLPTLHFMGLNPRSVDPFEVNSLSMFIQELFSRDQFFSRDSMGGFWGFWEFGAYVGVFFAIMAMMGAVVRFRRALSWSIAALVLLALAAGNHGSYSPWVLLHRLPVFSGEHAPTRMLMLLTLCFGVLAGFGVDALCSLKKWWLTAAVAILTLVAMVDCWAVSSPNSRYLLAGGKQEPFEPSPTFKQYYLQDSQRMFMMALANLGAVNCFEPASRVNRAHASNQEGYRGEQYLLGKGNVSLVRWTPNLLEYDVDAHGPAVLQVNQNFDPEWTVAGGKGEVLTNSALLSIQVPSGKQRLTIEYSGSGFLIGCEIFLIGILTAITLYVWCDVLGF